MYISLPSLHDYGVKIPNSPFMEDVINKQQRIFLSLSKLECGPQEINSREICHFQQFGISATKFKKTRLIHFKSDVFAAFAVVDAKTLNYYCYNTCL